MGLGHLGEFFAEEAPSDFDFEFTYRSEKNKDFSHFKNYHFDSKTSQDFPFAKDYDFVIWSFPPFDGYSALLERADKFFQSDCKWLYIGSTGVFGAGAIDEQSPLSFATQRSTRLARIEETLNSLRRDVLIIRPSGLIDEKRSPRTWTLKRKNISCSQNQMNLVYTRDVARFIVYAIKNSLCGPSYNLSASQHPVKESFYRSILSEDQFRDLIFDNKLENQKIISNKRSLETGFCYLVDKDLTQIYVRQ